MLYERPFCIITNVHLVPSPIAVLPKGRLRAGQKYVIFCSHILPVYICFKVETVAVLEVVSM